MAIILLLLNIVSFVTQVHPFPSSTSKTKSSYYHCVLDKNKFNSRLQFSQNSFWGVGDDWQQLSDESSNIDSSSIFHVDAASKAAKDLENYMNSRNDKDEIQIDQNDYFFDNYLYASDENEDSFSKSSIKEVDDDNFVESIIDKIQTESLDPNGPALYDIHTTHNSSKRDLSTRSTSTGNTLSCTDEVGNEISLLVRCNERPTTLLVDGGRALPTLTDEQKYDVSQLVSKQLKSTGGSYNFEPTDFFVQSVNTIFNIHAKAVRSEGNKNIKVLDSAGIASWLSKSLGESVGKHDKRVPVIMSKYATYGTGFLTQEQFMNVYFDAAMIGLDETKKLDDIKASKFMDKVKMKRADLMSVWRDFFNHDISSPIVAVREELQAKIDAEYGSYDFLSMEAMDECEILEWCNNDFSPRNNPKSSYQKVELTNDRQYAKRIRDGQFVFIDEESCIGCMQCVTIAPASFKMLDSGRAQTYHQSNSPDVDIAVSTCPVSCMHYLAFHELKEMETARDSDAGDGHNHHKHMMNSKGNTPVHIARQGSDMNHKSSWYHHLKQKCFTSRSCPKRGCYDCPNFSMPGDNPYFKEQYQNAERSRARDIMESGEGNVWRKTADL